jgi:surface antigen
VRGPAGSSESAITVERQRREALPTLGAYEVELKDGYVVAARDPLGTSWSSDAILDLEFDAEGLLVFARYADGTVWIASDSSSEIAAVISGLRTELSGAQDTPAAEEGGHTRAASDLVYRSGRAVIRGTRRRASSTQAFIGGLVATPTSSRRSSYPRLVTHAMVLGAVVAPVSIGVASAQTSPVEQTRLTVSYAVGSSAPAGSTVDALRSAAVLDEAAPAPPAVAAAPPSPAPAKPAAATVPRPIKPVVSTPGAIGKFPWGWCTWWVASKRTITWSGNAIEWWPNARAAGLAEGQTPKVGAIMVTRESGFGHVAYVESVDGNGGFTVSEMNFVGFGVVSQRHFNSNPSVLVGFIY